MNDYIVLKFDDLITTIITCFHCKNKNNIENQRITVQSDHCHVAMLLEKRKQVNVIRTQFNKHQNKMV